MLTTIILALIGGVVIRLIFRHLSKDWEREAEARANAERTPEDTESVPVLPPIERFIAAHATDPTFLHAADEQATYYRREWRSLDRLVAWARSKGFMFTADAAREQARAQAVAAGRSYTADEIDAVAHGLLMQGELDRAFRISQGATPGDILDAHARAARRSIVPATEVERFVSDLKDGREELKPFLDRVYEWDEPLEALVADIHAHGYRFTADQARAYTGVKAALVGRCYEGRRLDRLTHYLLTSRHFHDAELPFAVIERYAGP